MKLPVPEILRRQFSEPFIAAMRNRMVVGFYRHGPIAEQGRRRAIRYLEAKLAKYRETGNGELLVDIANCAMIEFMFPEHPAYHFRAEDQERDGGPADGAARNAP